MKREYKTLPVYRDGLTRAEYYLRALKVIGLCVAPYLVYPLFGI